MPDSTGEKLASCILHLASRISDLRALDQEAEAKEAGTQDLIRKDYNRKHLYSARGQRLDTAWRNYLGHALKYYSCYCPRVFIAPEYIYSFRLMEIQRLI